MPSSVRQGRESLGFIEYANTGNIDAPLPMYVLGSHDNSSIQFHLVGESGWEKTLRVVGIGDVEKNCVPPGTVFRIEFIFKVLQDGNGAITWTPFNDAVLREFLEETSICQYANGNYARLCALMTEMQSGKCLLAGSLFASDFEMDNFDGVVSALNVKEQRFYQSAISRNGKYCLSIDAGTYRLGVLGCNTENLDEIEVESGISICDTAVFKGNNLVISVRNFDFSMSRSYTLLAYGPNGETKMATIENTADVNFGRLSSGEWHVVCEDDMTNIINAVSVDLTATTNLILNAPLARRFSLLVHDKTGTPISSAKVLLCGRDVGMTDATGLFSAKSFISCLKDVRIVADGYAEAVVEIDDVADGAVCDVELEPAVAISGNVGNACGESGIITFKKADDGRMFFAAVDVAGAYTANIPTGEYDMLLDHESVRVEVTDMGLQQSRDSNMVNPRFKNSSSVVLARIRSSTSVDELESTESWLRWLKRVMLFPTARGMMDNYLGPDGSNFGYVPRNASKNNRWHVRKAAGRDWTNAKKPYWSIRDQVKDILKNRVKGDLLHKGDTINTDIKLDYNVNSDGFNKKVDMYLSGVCLAFGGLEKGTIRLTSAPQEEFVSETEDDATYRLNP